MQTFIKWSAISVVTFHNLVHSSDDSVDSIPKKESAYSSIEDDNEDDDNMLYDGSLYSGFTEEEREILPQSGRCFSTWKSNLYHPFANLLLANPFELKALTVQKGLGIYWNVTW